MPMQLLQRLCCAQLPMNIEVDDDIEKCAVLRAARLIEADIPPVLHSRGRSVYSGHATVMCVTPNGKLASAMRGRAPEDTPAFFPHPAKSKAAPERLG